MSKLWKHMEVMRENKGIPEILGSAFFSATVINIVIFVITVIQKSFL